LNQIILGKDEIDTKCAKTNNEKSNLKNENIILVENQEIIEWNPFLRDTIQ